MKAWIDSLAQDWARRRTGWRRARQLRRGQQSGKRAPRSPGAAIWIAAAGALAMLGGAVLIAAHARQLGNSAAPSAQSLRAAGAVVPAGVFQTALPGAAFTVPSEPGVTVTAHHGGSLLVVAGMRAAPPLKIDLCSQMLDRADARLLPLRIGYQFDDVARLVERQLTLRNIALAGSAAVPQIVLSGRAGADFNEAQGRTLQLKWASADTSVRWLSDAGAGQLRRDGWLIWKDAAMRLQRRASNACPQAGELLVQLYRPGDTNGAQALVTAFPVQGAAVSAWMAPARYQVPAMPPAALEDQALFQALLARGLVRLNAGGLIELAPRDLAAWQTAAAPARATGLEGWPALAGDPEAQKLLKRAHRMADGDYVREQIQIFNSERRLLAWRGKPGQGGVWRVSVAGAPVAASATMPPSAARLFDDVPQGWGAWQRVASWPQAQADAPARLTLTLPAPAQAGQTVQLMLIGRLASVEGATVRSDQDACDGRACADPGAAQKISLALNPGARELSLNVAPLSMVAMAGDQQYRHLRLAGGKLEWQALASATATARKPGSAGAALYDRNEVLLWSGGEPTRAAVAAGLAPMLGLRADHANSIGGMLARVAAPGGAPHQARLTIDLGMQGVAQGALDCIGMRRGQWDGKRCSGGSPVPAGREAGILILDTGNGDILAAAGAGTGAVGDANWSEVRDFDRANPARSPLRLPALQHDGGAHRSPGSTFKIISALGLELAARDDPQIESLLAGLPLAAINRMALTRGFAFQTDGASYPLNTRLAHITNYRDQHLDRRAQDGRFGLAQALTYSLNTWFAWSGELSDRSLFGRPDGGAPDLQALEPGALDKVRPIVAMAHRLGFEAPLQLDGGLLPPDFAWSTWDALQASPAHIDTIHTRHELRQMAIGLRMQVTPLQMAMVAGAVGQGRAIAPRLLLSLDGREAAKPALPELGVRLDRIRAGMKGVVDGGTAAGAFRGPRFDAIRRGLSGKTGTAPSVGQDDDGAEHELATVWFTGWLEPGSLPGQPRRLAIAAFVSHSQVTGGEHAAPIVAGVLAALARQNPEQRGK